MNGLIYLLSTLTSQVSKRMENPTFCTSYCVRTSYTIGISYILTPVNDSLCVSFIQCFLSCCFCFVHQSYSLSNGFLRFSIPCHGQQFSLNSYNLALALVLLYSLWWLSFVRGKLSQDQDTSRVQGLKEYFSFQGAPNPSSPFFRQTVLHVTWR